MRKFLGLIFFACPEQFRYLDAPFAAYWQGDTMTIHKVREGVFPWMKEFYMYGQWWNACLFYDGEVGK